MVWWEGGGPVGSTLGFLRESVWSGEPRRLWGKEDPDRRQLLLFPTSPIREEAVARCRGPEPSPPAQEEVHP